MIVYAPISVGELIDKITISKIKLTQIKEDTKLRNVKKELNELNNALNSLNLDFDITDETDRLQEINQQLWNVEDKIREKERLRQFDEFFIGVARLVYVLNDERASIKKEINVKVGSDLVEEKSYEQY